MAGPSRARQYLSGHRDPRRLRAAARAGSGAGSPGLWADVVATWRLLRAYLRGDYRAVRWRSILAVVTGVVYFLSPVDLIPDVFVLLGLTDDAIVVSLVFGVVRQELTGFRAWEQAQQGLDATVLRTVRSA
ncbi:YkvA family protein [Egicoccus sp. AB-alg2]|uniref:YkvA family protein n=1 Tax=Egicoccus sp. AB-alg2 TaxID=3242693 RepID=UPI00359ED744